MKRSSVLIPVAAILTALVALGSFGAATYSVFVRYEKITDASGNAIPLTTDGYRNTSIYLIPTAWSNSNLLSGASSVANCYVACCLYKADDSAYEWQFIRTCDENKALVSGNRTQITISATNYYAYLFHLDLTYYDRLSFHRIGYTSHLAAYMGEEVLDTFVSKSTDNTHVPLDWRNRSDDNEYRRYDATHRQTKDKTSNVFQITSTNSGGDYGFLAWGEWISNTII